jgi:hypothetical protein
LRPNLSLPGRHTPRPQRPAPKLQQPKTNWESPEASVQQSITNGGVVSLTTTVQQILMTLKVAEIEDVRASVVMKAVCGVVMWKQGSALLVRAVHFAPMNTPHPSSLRGGSKMEKYCKCLLYVTV